MIDYEDDYKNAFEDDRPRVFKLVTGEEIIATVIKTDDYYFIIENFNFKAISVDNLKDLDVNTVLKEVKAKLE